MASNRYKDTGSFDRSSQSDAGSTILKLTNKILADLQVDNIPSRSRSHNDSALGVVRTSRSYSDSAAAVTDAQQGPHPAYYDTVTLQPARNPDLVTVPINTSNELEDFDPFHSHSLPSKVPENDNWLSLTDNSVQEDKPTDVTSKLSKHLNEEGNNVDDEFWKYFGSKEHQSQTVMPSCHDSNVDSIADDNHAASQTATKSPNETENSIPQSKDTELTDDLHSVEHNCLEDKKDITIVPSAPTFIQNTEEGINDNEDEQFTGTVQATISCSESKPFVARFIKLSPFKSLDPELPRVKIIIVGDANTGKSCFLHKYIHGCFDYQSLPTVGVDICSLPLEDKKTGKRLVAQLWDTQGQERFNSLTTGYFRGAHAAIIVYDITNYKSLNSVYTWKVEVEKATSINPFTHIPTVLVGNKLDLTNKRETSEENVVANKLDIDRCFETSSKDGRGIDEVVDFLLEEIFRRNLLESNEQQQQPSDRVSLERIDNLSDKKSCCKLS